MLVLAAIFLFVISLSVIHFHVYGAGASFHTDPIHETYVLSLDDDDADRKNISSNLSVNSPKDQEVKADEVDNDTNDDDDANSNGAAKQHTNNANTVTSYRDEANVFLQVMNRSINFQNECNSLPEHHLGEAKPKEFDTGVPPLPEHGVHKAMKTWLDQEGSNNRGEYPMCSLPPTKECSVEQFTVILMSHTVEDDTRLNKLRQGISNLSGWKNTGEIILVWNNQRSVLEDCAKEHCGRINKWNADDKHKLRIFWALEEGMGNNLLNRYHPSIQPQHEAIVYFDDDGPFHHEIAMDVGFELWKFNADVQIGSMARNIRFPSERMDDLQNGASDLAAKMYQEDRWQTHVHPYDTAGIHEKIQQNSENDDAGFPQFTPICHDQTGDVVEYNYFVFPHWKAHMSLPSGSILHRNYLCFVWHPAFEELREFILNHPTHPDDMTISTLVSHLTGKPLRTFPRKVKNDGGAWRKDKERRLGEVAHASRGEEDDMIHENESNGNHKGKINTIGAEDEAQNRRRLLWQQKDWGNMREEAIDSIVGYFGSINPGSVGWCAGTKYQEVAKGRGNMRYNCLDSRPPDISMIPWMNKGGLAYDECH